METINNMAAAAAKVVWGEPVQVDSNSTATSTTVEPVSGKIGDTSKGEPFDAGNIEPQEAATKLPDAPAAPQVLPEILAESNKPSTTEPRPAGNSRNSKPAATQDPMTVPEAVADVRVRSPEVPPTIPEAAPADKDSTTMREDSSYAQVDTRDPSNKSTNPEHSETKEKLDIDRKAPDPKPVEEIAKQHEGDAGKVNTTTGEGKLIANAGPVVPLQTHDAAESHQAPAKGDGTDVVHTTGLAADGGNFDASVAGAGQEAKRLMHDASVHTAAGGTTQEGAASSDSIDSMGSKGSHGSSPSKEKLIDKIKRKLPIHRKHGEKHDSP